MSDATWTPYGLEAIRVRHLRRRRAAIFALVLMGALLWALFAPAAPTSESEIQIFANGKRAGGSLQIEKPEEDKPVTVAIQPGKITHASAGSAPGSETVTRPASVPVVPRAVPVPYVAVAYKLAPLVLIGIALWVLGKRKPAGHMVNYGIYKGALPLELISASASKRIFTTRHAGNSIFGKGRSDYLPAEVERVPQEQDA